MIDRLNEILKTVEIRDPIKTLFQPQMVFVPLLGGAEAYLRIDITSIDAIHGGKMQVPASFPISGYMAGRYVRKPYEVGAFVHDCLSQLMRHEVSESVWMNGTRPVKPVHWGAKMEDLESKI